MAVYKDTEEGVTVVYYHCKKTGRIFVIDVWLASKWKYSSKVAKRKRLIKNAYSIIRAKAGILPTVDSAEFKPVICGPLSQRLHDARS